MQVCNSAVEGIVAAKMEVDTLNYSGLFHHGLFLSNIIHFFSSYIVYSSSLTLLISVTWSRSNEFLLPNLTAVFFVQ